MSDLFSLGVELNTAQVLNGTKHLDGFVRSAAGVVTAIAGIAGATVGLNKSIDTIARFEDSTLGLQATINGTASEMAALEKQARTLGATSVYSAEQSAQAQRFLAQAGFSVDEVMKSTAATMQLATAGQLSLAEAADIASNVLGGMRLEVDQLNRVNDVMAKTAASSNTNIQQLGEALSYAAPNAADANISIEELSAAIGKLGDSGLQGSRAGTGIIGFIRQLSKVTPDAEAALGNYGISLSDVDIQANGLLNVMDNLSGVTFKTKDAFTIFGSEAKTAASILSSNAESTRLLTGELQKSQGAAKDMADIIGSGLSSAFKGFNSQIQESILNLGDSGLAAALMSVTESATGVLAVYNDLLPEYAEANELSGDQVENLDLLAGYVEAYAGAIGGAVVGLGAYRAAAWAATTATTGLSAAMRANPLGLLATAVGVAAGLYITLGENMDTAAEAADKLNKGTAALTITQKENARVSINSRLIQLEAELELMQEQEKVLSKQAEAGATTLYLGRAPVGGVEAIDDTIKDISEVEQEIEKLTSALAKLDGTKTNVEVVVDRTNEFNQLLSDKKIGVYVEPEVDSASKSAWKQYYGIMAQEMTPEVEEALNAVPSDFAMSVGQALASQDYSSFGNVLAGQAASYVGTAVTDAIGGAMGGMIGGFAGGAVGAVVGQVISKYLEEDDIAERRQATQGTGTVLGSIDEKSQSIANSMDYMTDGLDDLIGVNTAGFSAMQALVASVSGASDLIARDFNATGLAGNLGLTTAASMVEDALSGVVSVFDTFTGGLLGGAVDSLVGGISGALFGSTSITDEGIQLIGGSVAEMIENDIAQVYQSTKTKSLFSSSRSTSYRFAGDAIEQQFDLTIEAMRDAVITSAESLNMLPAEIQANLDQFTVETQKISIKDLSADEISEELQAVLSSIFDGMAATVVPYVTEFQQSGEGAGETLARLSTDLSVVNEMLSQLRLSDLQGSTQEMLTITEQMIAFFGDASSLATAFTGFVSEFATQERQLEILTDGLTEALGAQDVAILKSREGVYDYIASLEQLDGDNTERIANILGLTDSLDEYFDLLESFSDTAFSTLTGLVDSAMSNLESSIDSSIESITSKYEQQSETAQSLLDTLNDGLSDLQSVATSLQNAISSTVTLSYDAAKGQLSNARNQLAAFADSGIVPSSDELSGLLSAVTGDNEKYYKTAADYYRDQGQTANDIAFLSELADEQLTEAERQIKAQEDVLDQLKSQYNSDVEHQQALLESSQQEYNAMLGVNTSVLSVADAVLAVNATLQNLELNASGSNSATSRTAQINAIIENARSSYDTFEEQERSIALNALSQGFTAMDVAGALGISESRVIEAARSMGLPGFANGGTASGGLAMVGERGPEIINMPAGTHVSTANQTKSMLDNSELISLLKELIDKTIVQNGYVKSSRDILQRVTNGSNSINTNSIIIRDVTEA